MKEVQSEECRVQNAAAPSGLPEGWKIGQMECFGKIVGGGTPSTSVLKYWNGSVNWFTPAEISEDVKYVSKSKRTITEDGIANSAARVMPAGAILLTTRASIGLTAILTEPAATNQGFQSIIVNDANDHEFVYYYIATIKDEMLSRASGSTFLEISAKKLKSIPICIPPLSEQRAIAEVLGKVDALIANLAKRIEKKRLVREGVMHDLLTGKKRLPGFAGEWKTVKLGECATVKARIGWQGLTTAEYLTDGAHYLINGVNIVNGHVDWESCYMVDDNRYEQDRNIQLKKEDVLVSKDGTIGKVAFVDQLPKSATLNSGVFVIRSIDDSLTQEYLARVFLSKWFDDFIAKITAGSTIVHLYQKDIVSFAFPIPASLPEQRAIAGVLSAMDGEIAQLEAKREKYAKIKAGLMNDLLTGKVRVR